MTNVSFKTLDKVAGPLIFVKGVDNASYGEMVEIKLENGERRQGQVLDTSQGLAVVQVFGQTLGLNTTGTSTTFLGETATISVSDEMESCNSDYQTMLKHMSKDDTFNLVLEKKTKLQILINSGNINSLEWEDILGNP